MARSSTLTPLSIKRFFARLPEPRRRPSRVRHPLLNIVVMALCGVIAGADTWEEIARLASLRRDWLAKFLDLRHGIPSHDRTPASGVDTNVIADMKAERK